MGIGMQWYWIVIILSAIVAPWVAMGSLLRTAFQERGIIAGIAVWLGVGLVTTSAIFLFMWLARLVI
jgi:hypothetical protein